MSNLVIPIGWYVSIKRDIPNRINIRDLLQGRYGTKRAFKVLGYCNDEDGDFNLILEDGWGGRCPLKAEYFEVFCNNHFNRVSNI